MRIACLIVLLASGVGLSVPPAVEIPQETRATGDFVTLVPKTDAKTITYVALSGVDPFPSALLKDSRTFVLPVRGLPEGKYRFKGVASKNDEHTVFDFYIVVGKGSNDDKISPVPPIPVPPAPDVQKVDKVFVVVVEDANATRSIETAKMLNDPYWKDLKQKNDYRHYRSSSSTAIESGFVAEAERVEVGYPAVIVIDPATNKVLKSFKFTTMEALKQTVASFVK
jgi:hypothetical protein